LYHATAVALRDAATDPEVAVVLLTGAGRAFSAGNDLNEMQRRITDPTFNDQGSHFSTMIDALTALPKPLICAVNGVGVGIGATILGYADLVFIVDGTAEDTLHQPGRCARGRVLASLPLMGRQNAAWLLMSSEIDAASRGWDWRGRCEPDDLLPEACRHAEILPPADFEPDGASSRRSSNRPA
jgi:enoyl-CoA hydratase/carnithine racemase